MKDLNAEVGVPTMRCIFGIFLEILRKLRMTRCGAKRIISIRQNRPHRPTTHKKATDEKSVACYILYYSKYALISAALAVAVP